MFVLLLCDQLLSPVDLFFFRCCRLHTNVLPNTLRGAPALCHRLLKMRLRLGAADRKKVPRGLEAVVTIMQFWN